MSDSETPEVDPQSPRNQECTAAVCHCQRAYLFWIVTPYNYKISFFPVSCPWKQDDQPMSFHDAMTPGRRRGVEGFTSHNSRFRSPEWGFWKEWGENRTPYSEVCQRVKRHGNVYYVLKIGMVKLIQKPIVPKFTVLFIAWTKPVVNFFFQDPKWTSGSGDMKKSNPFFLPSAWHLRWFSILFIKSGRLSSLSHSFLQVIHPDYTRTLDYSTTNSINPFTTYTFKASTSAQATFP